MSVVEVLRVLYPAVDADVVSLLWDAHGCMESDELHASLQQLAGGGSAGGSGGHGANDHSTAAALRMEEEKELAEALRASALEAGAHASPHAAWPPVAGGADRSAPRHHHVPPPRAAAGWSGAPPAAAGRGGRGTGRGPASRVPARQQPHAPPHAQADAPPRGWCAIWLPDGRVIPVGEAAAAGLPSAHAAPPPPLYSPPAHLVVSPPAAPAVRAPAEALALTLTAAEADTEAEAEVEAGEASGLSDVDDADAAACDDGADAADAAVSAWMAASPGQDATHHELVACFAAPPPRATPHPHPQPASPEDVATLGELFPGMGVDLPALVRAFGLAEATSICFSVAEQSYVSSPQGGHGRAQSHSGDTRGDDDEGASAAVASLLAACPDATADEAADALAAAGGEGDMALSWLLASAEAAAARRGGSGGGGGGSGAHAPSSAAPSIDHAAAHPTAAEDEGLAALTAEHPLADADVLLSVLRASGGSVASARVQLGGAPAPSPASASAGGGARLSQPSGPPSSVAAPPSFSAWAPQPQAPAQARARPPPRPLQGMSFTDALAAAVAAPPAHPAAGGGGSAGGRGSAGGGGGGGGGGASSSGAAAAPSPLPPPPLSHQHPPGHVPPASERIDYEALRGEEFKHRRAARALRDEAEAAFRCGDKAASIQLMAAKRAADERARAAGERASATTFSRVNAVTRSHIAVDLHGQHVPDALAVVHKYVEMAVNIFPGCMELTIITGRGAHSPDGVAKLQPAVCDFLASRGVPFAVASKGGALVVVVDDTLRAALGERDQARADDGASIERADRWAAIKAGSAVAAASARAG